MNNLERIKKVEDEVEARIRDARLVADARISKIKATEEQIIQKETEKVKSKLKKEIEDAKVKAKSDEARIIADGENEIKKIRSMASKRSRKAVEIIITELKGD